MPAWFGRNRRRVLSSAAAVAVVGVLTTLAVTSAGYRTQNTELDDAAVWVVNDEEGAVGRANLEVLELNSAFLAESTDLDVLQRGATVVQVDRASSSVAAIDVATARPGEDVPLPPGTDTVGLAGDRLVVVADGGVWFAPLDDLEDFDASSAPTLTLGTGSVAAVTPDGRLTVYSPSLDEVYSLDATTAMDVETTTAVEPFEGDELLLTTVGTHTVLLDVENGVLDVDGQRTTLDVETTGARLEAARDSGSSVAIATRTGLLEVPVDGAVRAVADAAGEPAQPARWGECLYGAWDDGTVVERCGSDDARPRTLDGLRAGAAPVFRENRGRVVLNDARSGATWAVQDGDALIDNWDDLIDEDDDRLDVEQNDEDAPPEYDTDPAPPVAVDDEFGARPGRTSPLPVLLNDYDPNGDVIVIDDVSAIPEELGTVDIVADGQALQVTLADEASGDFSVDYTVSDGRGGAASASVAVTVRGDDENAAPVQLRAPKTLVGAGGRVSTNALTTWFDPDGDPFYLSAVSAAAPDIALSKPDGTVVFTSAGESLGRSDVALTVSDGRAEGAGRLSVTIRESDDVPIIVEPFAAVAHTQREITVSPIAHARGGVQGIRLAGVTEEDGATIVPDYDAGTFRFTAATAGVYYVEFSLTDGTSTTAGTVRVEVTTPPAVGERPIPAPHTLFVRAGTPQTAEVLDTDRDPAGGVLLVTGADTADVASSVRVEVLEQRSIRVLLTGPLDAPVSFPYTISNGFAEATGSVTVIEIPEPERPQPPIAAPDSISVRVGDVTDIPVLDNDEHPDGSPLTLSAELPKGLPADGGLVFVSGDVVRYLAPETPGEFTVTYRVFGPDGQWADADVTISVREVDRSSNTPPAPRTVTARAFAGETVRIGLPLAGIDPDGDSVQLVGQSSSPELGNVTASGTAWLDYEAGAYASGTDTFGYTVIDALGAQATGTVRIGVAPRADDARNPVAVEDLVMTRPSRVVTVPVLENDSDPDGGALQISSVEPSDPSVSARIVGSTVQVTVPDEPGRYGFVYTIGNERGGSSSNFLTVVADPDAPPAVPVARDSVVRVEDVLDRDSVTVDVRANVTYLDGPVEDLEVDVPDRFSEVASVTESGSIVVTIGDSSRIVPFRVSDPGEDDVEAWAFVRVPGLDDALPQLRSTADPLRVRSGESLEIELADYVVAIGGRDVRLTDRSTVRATHANGDDLVIDDDTLVFTSADAYFGPASIAFEVTDGTSATDPDGRIATLVLPITVTPRENQPPVFTGASLDVEPGESRTLDLTRLTTYPYPDNLDKLAFEIVGTPSGDLGASIDGGTITIDLPADADIGSTGSVTVSVSDGTATGDSGRIDVRAVPSTRPLAIPAADAVQVARGSTSTVDVLANDTATNPFPETPLRVVDVRGLDGAGVPGGVTISPSPDRSELTVTVAQDAAIGDAVLQYQVADATDDSSRYVWGTVRVSVQDRPEPVTALVLRSASDRALTLGWTPGVSNNSPITSFTVTTTRVSTGAVYGSTTCTSSSCTVETPGNGRENAVRVEVTATNAVGTSEPTALGAAVWSDVIPPAPGGLSSTPLDQGLRVSWTKPADGSGASPIVAYDVTVGSITRTLTVGRGDPVGTRYVQSIQSADIPNGTPVAFSVQSRNDFSGASPRWNSASASNTPAGAPLASGAPSAEADQESGTSVRVQWGGVFSGNGATISRYYVGITEDGTTPMCVVEGVEDGSPQLRTSATSDRFVNAGTATAHVFRGLEPNRDYRVHVFAYNGQGCTSSSPVGVLPRQRPGTPTVALDGPTQSSPGVYTFEVTRASYSSGGGASARWEYELTAGGVTVVRELPVGTGRLQPADGRFNWQTSVRARVCESIGGTELCSEWNDLGVVGAPVDLRLDGLRRDILTGTYTWTGASPINGQPSTALEVSCDNRATWTPLTARGGECTNPDPLTWSGIIVRADLNGQTYAKQW